MASLLLNAVVPEKEVAARKRARLDSEYSLGTYEACGCCHNDSHRARAEQQQSVSESIFGVVVLTPCRRSH